MTKCLTSVAYRQLLQDVMLSLNVALATIWLKVSTTRHWHLLEELNDIFPPNERGSDNHAAGYTSFFLLVAVAAMVLFVMLRLLSRSSWLNGLSRFGRGVLALLALPAAWFYVVTVLGPLSFEANLWWFPIEGGAVVLCLYSYTHRELPVRSWVVPLFIALHYALWGWILSRHFLGARFWMLFPAVGISSAFAWNAYVVAARTEGTSHAHQIAR